MYEKPQYLTPGGFRRSAKNPLKDKKAITPLPAKKTISANRLKKAGIQISEATAKLIADAIKSMLKQR
jgi:hypothetical protein